MPAGGQVLICAKSVCLKSKTGIRMPIQSNILSNMNEHKLSVKKYRVINIILLKGHIVSRTYKPWIGNSLHRL